MENYTAKEKANSFEAVRMSLQAVADWLPRAGALKNVRVNENQEMTEEMRSDLVERINVVTTEMASMNPTEFDIQNLFTAGHGDIVLNCLEFYGQYISDMLTHIGNMYNLSFKEKFGMLPEDLNPKNHMEVHPFPEENCKICEILKR